MSTQKMPSFVGTSCWTLANRVTKYDGQNQNASCARNHFLLTRA